MADDSPTPPDAATTQWLLDWGRNDKQGLDQMLPVVYQELHRLASRYMSQEPTGHTLQPTALVHEAYLRLIDQRRVEALERKVHELSKPASRQKPRAAGAKKTTTAKRSTAAKPKPKSP